MSDPYWSHTIRDGGALICMQQVKHLIVCFLCIGAECYTETMVQFIDEKPVGTRQTSDCRKCKYRFPVLYTQYSASYYIHAGEMNLAVYVTFCVRIFRVNLWQRVQVRLHMVPVSLSGSLRKQREATVIRYPLLLTTKEPSLSGNQLACRHDHTCEPL